MKINEVDVVRKQGTTSETQILTEIISDFVLINKINDFLTSIINNNETSIYIEKFDNHTDLDKFVNQELIRPIGRHTKIRILYAIGSDLAKLIIISNSQFISYQEVLAVKNNVLNCTNLNIAIKEQNKHVEITKQPTWGCVRSFGYDFINETIWNQQIITSVRYREEDFLKTITAMLKKYSSDNLTLLVTNQSIMTSNLRTVTYDALKDRLVEEKLNDYPKKLDTYIHVIVSELENKSQTFYPYQTSDFPLCISVSKINEEIQDIQVGVDNKFIDKQVSNEFSTLLRTLYRESENNSVAELVNKSLYPSDVDGNVLSIQNGGQNNESNNLLSYFKSIVNYNGSKIAVSDDLKKYTYDELDRLSDIVAINLHEQGVNPGDKVIVAVDQNAYLIPTILGVIKANAIYIPVNPEYPIERINFIIDDSNAKFIIATSELKQKVTANLQKLNFEEVLIESDAVSDWNLIDSFDVNQSGYVIYTSGTTGKPKGVNVPSQNIVSLIAATKSELQLSSKDVWTMFHSYSFDFSVWEMWGSLLTGGHLIVVPRSVARSPYDFYDLVVKNGVTVLNQTPSAFYILEKIDFENDDRQLNKLRLVVFGGEALSPNKLKNWLERYSATQCRLVNMYGITETTIHVTHKDINRDELDSKSIGWPLNGWDVSIRKDNGDICLHGMEGEIWVAGLGVAKGYLNREKLNAEKFIIDDKCWYRSGDLGRMYVDGSIDYLGRIDNQVKIRGFRIELGEIKNVMEQIPTIEDVVVAVKEGKSSTQKEIIAFVKGNIDPISIHESLVKQLPEYMIPSRIIQVDDYPMTINGKVDERALFEKADDVKQVISETDTRKGDPLTDLWSEVLGHIVTEDAYFFENGGNSLLAVELISGLRKMGYSFLKLKDIYVHSSPIEMKKFIDTKVG